MNHRQAAAFITVELYTFTQVLAAIAAVFITIGHLLFGLVEQALFAPPSAAAPPAP